MSARNPSITAAPTGWHNPLRDKRDKRMPRIAGPCGVVIFGVTGDLSRKKLMPAIYDLANRGLLPPSFALTGYGRDEDKRQARAAGFDDHLVKPVDVDMLRAVLRRTREASHAALAGG